MYCKNLDKYSKEAVTELFTSAFTASEGEKEGRLIGNLASELSSEIDDREILCFGACEGESIIGSIFFTPLRFKAGIEVYMLAPVAVRTEHQGKGVGQALIRYGLDELKNRSVDVAVTYGDPAYYSRVGFRPLSEKVLPAPHELSMPFGWQGQSLAGEPIPALDERPACVRQFNDPALW